LLGQLLAPGCANGLNRAVIGAYAGRRHASWRLRRPISASSSAQRLAATVGFSGFSFGFPAGAAGQALNEAGQIIAEYLEPGPRNAKEMTDELIRTLDNERLATALERLANGTELKVVK
jgi:hypothetical protein